jgi:hypothetical protein
MKYIVDIKGEIEGDYEIIGKYTVQPEHKHGKWIKDCNVAFYWKCSECGAYLFWRKEDYLLRKNDNLNYCPNCGADMRSKNEEMQEVANRDAFYWESLND